MAWVAYIIGTCPGCGAQESFGHTGVFASHITLGCTCCQHLERIPLPQIRKKVLYLDQFFFSHAFRGDVPRFLDAARRIERLASLQLLVVPYSSIHEDETHLWKQHAGLTKFIKTTARGHEFVPAYVVEQTQIISSFRSWLEGGPPAYRINLDEALGAEARTWEDYVRADVGIYLGNIDRTRALKALSVERLIALFDGWERLTTTFEEDLQEEYTASVKKHFTEFLSYVERVRSGDPMAWWDSSIASMVVENMLRVLPRDLPIQDKLQQCDEYFRSSHYLEAPFHWIRAHIFATLKVMVKEDRSYANRNKASDRLKGFFYDVDHIATYAPYVDAILTDKPMAELVARRSVALEARYGVRVFSLNTWDDFMAWLDDVEATGMTKEHRTVLQAAYPTIKF